MASHLDTGSRFLHLYPRFRVLLCVVFLMRTGCVVICEAQWKMKTRAFVQQAGRISGWPQHCSHEHDVGRRSLGWHCIHVVVFIELAWPSLSPLNYDASSEVRTSKTNTVTPIHLKNCTAASVYSIYFSDFQKKNPHGNLFYIISAMKVNNVAFHHIHIFL